MKVKILMTTLAIALLMGVQGFANPCDSACVDPCAACNRNVVKCDLFSGLKKLVNGSYSNSCDPCDAVVACNPCDEAFCDPCGFDACSTPRFGLGGRLRNLFASHGCNPCEQVSDCTPCDPYAKGCEPCDPCGFDSCGRPKFVLRSLFSSLRLSRGCDTDCTPCDVVGNCDPCDPCGTYACDPCAEICGDTYCGPRGHLFDLPRISLGKLFGGFRLARCHDGVCNPCDEVKPCDSCYR